MTKKPAAKPTPAEVEILGILWERGPSTVREVHERLGADRSVGYTGVLKLLQNMHAKELVQRRQDGQAHVYEAREPGRMKRQLLGDLVQQGICELGYREVRILDMSRLAAIVEDASTG